jgi:hypothetical protein
MSEVSKAKMMKAIKISKELADVLEYAGFNTPKDIKLADDADLELSGLSEDEIQEVRVKCPHFKKPKD